MRRAESTQNNTDIPLFLRVVELDGKLCLQSLDDITHISTELKKAGYSDGMIVSLQIRAK